MRLTFCLALAAFASVALCRAGSRTDQWAIREQETVNKTLTLSGAPMRLVVDNFDGYVHVTGAAGSEVRMTAHKIIRAETDSDLQEARNEVKLDATQKPGMVSIYYDAPWRCNCEGHGCHGEQRRFYSVTYDIDVEVPREARTVISTVNHGDVRVENVEGDFDIGNINGGISMSSISGSGDVHTINGPITVHFTRNPARPSTFKSLNGRLDIYFQSGLRANLLFKTFNGEIYSDFDVTPRALTTGQTERRDGKFIYHSNRARGGSTGGGGPELTFDAFNGNICLHREQ